MPALPDLELPGHCDFRFWTPPAGAIVPVGPEAVPVPLPLVPLPIRRADSETGEPDANTIGAGVYDYLRQFPDCRHNRVFAELLRDAFSHYLADLGAQLVMLDAKEVDAPYLRRKVSYLKILALLQPASAGLQQQLGLNCFHLALSFSEMGASRSHLQQALGHLQRARDFAPNDATTLNLLGRVDYLFGDYPAARRSWLTLLELLPAGEARTELAAKTAELDGAEPPEHPLVEDLEAVGVALTLCGEGDFAGARSILDGLEEAAVLTRELPSSEFFYLLGLCRARTGDPAGAFAAFDQALVLDPDYQPATAARERILEGRQP